MTASNALAHYGQGNRLPFGDFDHNLNSYKQELYSKEELEHILPLGTQFFYVGDLSDLNTIQFLSPGFSSYMGYTEECIDMDFIYHIIHPDDKEAVLKASVASIQYACERKYSPAFEFNFFIDFRMRRKDNTYARMLRHTANFKNDKLGNIVFYIASFTDISYMNKKSMDFMMQTADPRAFDFSLEPTVKIVYQFSRRERDIVTQLSSGKSSKEIAQQLSISKNTVDTHRRKLLEKTHTRNTAELISYSIDTRQIARIQ